MTEENEEPINLIPLLTRTFAWDVLPCNMVNDFFPTLGLVPGSPEGVANEHHAKHVRFDRVAPIRGVVEVYTAIVSDVITKVMLHYDDENRRAALDAGPLKQMTAQNQEVIRIALYASLSQMLENGILTLGKAVV